MFKLRAISTSAARYTSITRFITKFPVELRIRHPMCPYSDEPISFTFSSFRDISGFLAPSDFLVNPTSMAAIRHNQVQEIDPEVVYDLVCVGHCLQ